MVGQLNGFGFRRTSIGNFPSPCVYVHDALWGRPPEAILTLTRKSAPKPAASPSTGGAPDHIAADNAAGMDAAVDSVLRAAAAEAKAEAERREAEEAEWRAAVGSSPRASGAGVRRLRH